MYTSLSLPSSCSLRGLSILEGTARCLFRWDSVTGLPTDNVSASRRHLAPALAPCAQGNGRHMHGQDYQLCPRSLLGFPMVHKNVVASQALSPLTFTGVQRSTLTIIARAWKGVLCGGG